MIYLNSDLLKTTFVTGVTFIKTDIKKIVHDLI